MNEKAQSPVPKFCLRMPSRRDLRAALQTTSHIMLPSFLFKSEAAPRVRSRGTNVDTAWLDGLRGLASITVFIYHFLFAFTMLPQIGYSPGYRQWLRLPGIRIIFDDFDGVAIFFIVSGYVCSLKALQHIVNEEPGKARETLEHSIFRRPFRLYMPVLVISLMTAMSAYFGAFEILRPMMIERQKYFPGRFIESGLTKYPTLLWQLHFWQQELFSLMNPGVLSPQWLQHDSHLWTIPYEFRGSMCVYLTLAAVAGRKHSAQLLVLVTLGVFSFCWHFWEGPLFFGGAVIALLKAMQEKKPTLLLGTSQSCTCQNRQRKMLRPVGYIICLYLASYPSWNYDFPTPGFCWMNQFIPSWMDDRPDRLPKSIAGLLFVYLLSTSEHMAESVTASLFHKVFTSKIAQYMGQIMFAFYLVHGPILHSFGYGIPHGVWYYIGQETTFTYVAGLIVGLLMCFVASIWTADVFSREVEGRCVRLIKWLEKRSLA